MKHLKRCLAIVLTLFMLFEFFGPAMPGLGSLTAQAAGMKWLSGNKVDVNALLKQYQDRKDITDSSSIKWTEVGQKGQFQQNAWDLDNFYQSYDSYFTSSKYTYIKLVGDLGHNYSKNYAKLTKNAILGEEIWDRAYVINSSKVIDLNGHQMAFHSKTWSSSDSDTANLTYFYITGKDTTVIFIDSSPDKKGAVRFIGAYHGTGSHYTEYIQRNLFDLRDGASLYILGGTFQAGGMRQQDVESTWDKVKRIGGSVLKACLSLGSAAASVCATIATGGMAAGSLSESLGQVSELLDMGTSTVSSVVSGFGLGSATSAANKNPQNMNQTTPGDTADTNGKNAGATTGNKAGATNAKPGTGSSVVSDIAGVYDVVNEEGCKMYKTTNNSFDNYFSPTNYFIGDQVAVIGVAKDKDGNDTDYYQVLDGTEKAYMLQSDLVSAVNHTWTSAQLKTIAERKDPVKSLNDSTMRKLQEIITPPPDNPDNLTKAKGYINTIKNIADDAAVSAAVQGMADLISQCTASGKRFYQVHWGTVATVNSGCRLVIFEGNFIGYGQDKEEARAGHTRARNEVIECVGGETYIFGGKFYAMAGANIFYKNTAASLTIRGGEFDCSSVNVFRGLYNKQQNPEADFDGEATENIVGTRGSVNADISCYGEDMIADGRIQLNESAGAGNLVLKNTDPLDNNRIMYTLYCDPAKIGGLAHLKVSPMQSEYMQKTFKLIANADQDGVLDGQNYVNYIAGNEGSYIAPKFFGDDASAVVSTVENTSSIAAAIESKGGFYYSFPQTDLIKNLRVEYTRTMTVNGQPIGWKYSGKYFSQLRTYSYDVYEIDPITQANVSDKPIASTEVSDQDILTGQVYMCPNKGNTQPYLMEKDQWKPGTMYRIKLTVTEYLGVGGTQYNTDSYEDTKYINKAAASTSVIVRCREKDEARFTPLHFRDEDLHVGDAATVDFINAKPGLIDIYGEKLFSVTYDWRVEGYDDVHLVTTTRVLHEGEGKTFTVNGHVYDQEAIQYGQTLKFPGTGKQIETFAGSPVLGSSATSDQPIAVSLRPGYSASDSLTLPETFVSNGKTVELAGKSIYCEVTYGLCYPRWSRAFKYLPICDYQKCADALYALDANKDKTNITLGDADLISEDDNDAGIRDTVQGKTFRTKSIEVKQAQIGDTKIISRVTIDYKLPMGNSNESPYPTTTTPGVKITDAYFVMFHKRLDHVETGDLVAVEFQLEAEDGYQFSTSFVAWLNDLNDPDADDTPLTRIAVTDPKNVRCFLAEYRVPPLPGGNPIDSVPYVIVPPVAGETPADVAFYQTSGGAHSHFQRYSKPIVEQSWSPAHETFREGEQYTVTVRMATSEDYESSIASPVSRFTEDTTVKLYQKVDDKNVFFGYAVCIPDPDTNGQTATFTYTFPRLGVPTHKVTVTSGTAGVDAAPKDNRVAITADDPPAGKMFDKWVVVKGGVTLEDAAAAETGFIMGDADVEVKATYKDIPAGSHAVKVTSGTANPTAAAKGATVTITASAAPEGKTFDKWEVVKGGVTLADAAKATTTFVMGDADVEVKATYKDKPASPPDNPPDNPPEQTVMLGDVDGDGQIKSGDAREALRAAVKLEPFWNQKDSAKFLAADIDKNGAITSNDARSILRASVKLEDPTKW